MSEYIDLRDLQLFGEQNNPNVPVLKNRKAVRTIVTRASRWLNDPRSINPTTGKAPKGLIRYDGPRIFKIRDQKTGKIETKIIYQKGKTAEVMNIEAYMNKLKRSSGISKKDLYKQFEKWKTTKGISRMNLAGKHGLDFDKAFKDWYETFVRDQLSEQDYWRKLGKQYQDAGLAKDEWRALGKDQSHWWAKSEDGSAFTFLEDWEVNQKRGATPFAGKDQLKRLGVPTNNEELFDTIFDQVIGQENAEGILQPIKPIGGILNLEQVGGYEAAALQRGESAEVILNRIRITDAIQDEAEALLDAGKPIPKELQDEYTRNLIEYRGPLAASYTDSPTGKQYIDDLVGQGWSLNDILNDPYHRSKITETNLEDDIEVMREAKRKYQESGGKYRGKYSGGGPPDATLSPDPSNRFGLGKKLTIGSGLAWGLGEAGMAAINPETGYHAGRIASGEGDMSNVTGAAKGIGQDLLVGGGVRGATRLVQNQTLQKGLQRAFNMAGKRGIQHFAGKSLLGKAVPYVGWGLLAYGVYDTADAFTEGLTGKGITERIKEVDYEGIINDVYSDNNSIFRRGKEQDTANLTTM